MSQTTSAFGFGSPPRKERTDGEVSLQPFLREHAEGLFEGVRESIAVLPEWLPWCKPNYSLADATSFACSQAAAWLNGTEYGFAIVSPTSGRVLGGIGFNYVDRQHLFANLGYWVRSSECNHGICTRAAKLALQFAFMDAGFHHIQVIVACGNVPSQRVAEKLGAARLGRLPQRLWLRGQCHDAFLYSILRPADIRNVSQAGSKH